MVYSNSYILFIIYNIQNNCVIFVPCRNFNKDLFTYTYAFILNNHNARLNVYRVGTHVRVGVYIYKPSRYVGK